MQMHRCISWGPMRGSAARASHDLRKRREACHALGCLRYALRLADVDKHLQAKATADTVLCPKNLLRLFFVCL